MIHIDLDGKSPPDEWLAQANSLTEELIRLDAAHEYEARDKLIEDNQDVWRDLRGWLKELSFDKCWYSEAKNCASYWHVDHFRPKKKVSDLYRNTTTGYWWLSFKWQNYRLCGSATNVPKSIKFPIREGTLRATGPNQDENDESPYLLDPVIPEDPGLLSFNENGEAIPADPDGPWNKDRAKETITILNLNYADLRRGRKVRWEECDRRVNQARNLMAELQDQDSVTKRTELRNTIQEIKRMAAKSEEFSAVVRICVRSQGVEWLSSHVLTA